MTAASRCRWHSGLCRYDDTDPARCPLCHRTLTLGACGCVADGAHPLTVDRLAAILDDGPGPSDRDFARRHGLDVHRARKIRTALTTTEQEPA